MSQRNIPYSLVWQDRFKDYLGKMKFWVFFLAHTSSKVFGWGRIRVEFWRIQKICFELQAGVCREIIDFIPLVLKEVLNSENIKSGRLWIKNRRKKLMEPMIVAFLEFLLYFGISMNFAGKYSIFTCMIKRILEIIQEKWKFECFS